MIPQSKLVLSNFKPGEITLGELIIFEGGSNLEVSFAVKKFLARNETNWSKEEQEAITIGDMAKITGMIFEAVTETAIPKVSETFSDPGPD